MCMHMYAMLITKICAMQLLEALGMPEHKEAVWLFFEAHVVPAIRKYQLDEHDGGIEKGLTAAKFEEDLLQLVTTEPPSEVQ